MMVTPALAAVTLVLVWLLAVAAAQTRTVDAAREVARALARDEPRSSALALGRRVAPPGARFDVAQDDDEVVVEVRAEVGGDDGLLRFVPSFALRAEAVAAREPR